MTLSFSSAEQLSSLPKSASGQIPEASDPKSLAGQSSQKERQSASFFGRVANLSQVH